MGPTTVRFTTTADTPDAGTPPRPVTTTSRTVPVVNGAFGVPRPERVSTMRAGATVLRREPAGPPTGPNQPWTSTTTCAEPAATASEIRPPAPTGTTAWFATTEPARKFTFEVMGCDWPDGQAVRWLDAVGPTTVRLTTTADTPDAGTPPRPVTTTSRTDPPANGAPGVPRPDRVSTIRAGVTGRSCVGWAGRTRSNDPASSDGQAVLRPLHVAGEAAHAEDDLVHATERGAVVLEERQRAGSLLDGQHPVRPGVGAHQAVAVVAPQDRWRLGVDDRAADAVHGTVDPVDLTGLARDHRRELVVEVHALSVEVHAPEDPAPLAPGRDQLVAVDEGQPQVARGAGHHAGLADAAHVGGDRVREPGPAAADLGDHHRVVRARRHRDVAGAQGAQERCWSRAEGSRAPRSSRG